jgi:hypothetical protein
VQGKPLGRPPRTKTIDITIAIPALDSYVAYLKERDAAKITQMESDMDELNQRLAQADAQLEAAMKGK